MARDWPMWLFSWHGIQWLTCFLSLPKQSLSIWISNRFISSSSSATAHWSSFTCIRSLSTSSVCVLLDKSSTEIRSSISFLITLFFSSWSWVKWSIVRKLQIVGSNCLQIVGEIFLNYHEHQIYPYKKASILQVTWSCITILQCTMSQLHPIQIIIVHFLKILFYINLLIAYCITAYLRNLQCDLQARDWPVWMSSWHGLQWLTFFSSVCNESLCVWITNCCILSDYPTHLPLHAGSASPTLSKLSTSSVSVSICSHNFFLMALSFSFSISSFIRWSIVPKQQILSFTCLQINGRVYEHINWSYMAITSRPERTVILYRAWKGLNNQWTNRLSRNMKMHNTNNKSPIPWAKSIQPTSVQFYFLKIHLNIDIPPTPSNNILCHSIYSVVCRIRGWPV